MCVTTDVDFDSFGSMTEFLNSMQCMVNADSVMQSKGWQRHDRVTQDRAVLDMSNMQTRPRHLHAENFSLSDKCPVTLRQNQTNFNNIYTKSIKLTALVLKGLIPFCRQFQSV